MGRRTTEVVAATNGGPAPGRRARSQTIERAALVLTCFSAEEPQLGLAELAARLDLNASTVYRYVATLEDAGLLVCNQRGGYRLGLRVIELTGIALNQIEVRKHALDEMDRLRDAVNLLTNLAVLLDGDVLHLAHAAPKSVPRMYTALGRRAVAHCTSLGKPSNPFIGIVFGFYWSATLFDSSAAWVISFAIGAFDSDGRGLENGGFVWCVRGGQGVKFHSPQ
jgi:hypothetical protein